MVANLSATISVIVTAFVADIVAVALADVVTVVATIVVVEVDDITDNYVVMVVTVLNILAPIVNYQWCHFLAGVVAFCAATSVPVFKAAATAIVASTTSPTLQKVE